MSLLSVIIPVYNVEQYLERCVLSVVYQTYTNIEILLVDDGSTDASGKICDSLGKKYKNVVVLHKENGGLSDARNAGLKAATGDYITFLDSDDYIHPRMYEILLSQLIDSNADIVECELTKVYSYLPPFPKINSVRSIIMSPEEAILSGYDWKYFTAVVWNKIYKRHLLQEKYFPIGVFHEDEFWTHEILYSASTLVHICEPLHYYQQRTGSIMGMEFNSKHAEAVDALKRRIDFFKDKNEVLYRRGCIYIVEHILLKMQYLSNKSFSNREALKLYKAYGKKFQKLDQEIINVYLNQWSYSSKRILAIKLLYRHPNLFRYIYHYYEKFIEKRR